MRPVAFAGPLRHPRGGLWDAGEDGSLRGGVRRDLRQDHGGASAGQGVLAGHTDGTWGTTVVQVGSRVRVRGCRQARQVGKGKSVWWMLGLATGSHWSKQAGQGRTPGVGLGVGLRASSRGGCSKQKTGSAGPPGWSCRETLTRGCRSLS